MKKYSLIYLTLVCACATIFKSNCMEKKQHIIYNYEIFKQVQAIQSMVIAITDTYEKEKKIECSIPFMKKTPYGDNNLGRICTGYGDELFGLRLHVSEGKSPAISDSHDQYVRATLFSPWGSMSLIPLLYTVLPKTDTENKIVLRYGLAEKQEKIALENKVKCYQEIIKAFNTSLKMQYFSYHGNSAMKILKVNGIDIAELAQNDITEEVTYQEQENAWKLLSTKYLQEKNQKQ